MKLFSDRHDYDDMEIRQLEARVKELEQALEDQQADIDLLSALRGAGVDNWEGYDMVLEDLYGD